MNRYALLYYLLGIVRKGHEAQYQNDVLSNQPPKLYFTDLQWVAILVITVLIVTNPDCITGDLITLLTGIFSILLGLFLSLVVTIKSQGVTPKTAVSENQKIIRFKKNNANSHFVALTTYAIMIAIGLLVTMCIYTLVPDHHELSKHSFAHSIDTIDWALSLKCTGLLCLRGMFLYWTMNFFIITLYAVASLFCEMQHDVDQNKEQFYVKLNSSLIRSDKETALVTYRTPIRISLFFGSVLVALLIIKLLITCLGYYNGE